jgi:hypothetical protein
MLAYDTPLILPLLLVVNVVPGVVILHRLSGH